MLVTLGAMANPLMEQLDGFVSKQRAEAFDKFSRAITLLRIQGLITEAETHKARKRLMKKIKYAIIAAATAAATANGRA